MDLDDSGQDRAINPIDVQSNPFQTPSEVSSPDGPVPFVRAVAGDRNLIAIYGLVALSGIANVFSFTAPAYLLSFLLAFAVTNWAVVDSRSRDLKFPGIIRVIYFLVWPLASLIYLIATRRFRGILWWVANAVGMIAVMLVTFIPTVLLLYWFGSTDLIDPALSE